MRWVVALLAACLLPLAPAPYAAAQRPAAVRKTDQAKLAPLEHRHVRRVTDLLDWHRVGYPRSASVWTNAAWTLAVGNQLDRWVELTGPDFRKHWDVPDQDHYVDGTFLDQHWAVFGIYSRTRDKLSPPVYRAVDLATGRTEVVDASLTGKALWADDYLGGRLLVSVRRAGQWCLGYVDLQSRTVDDGPCPPPGRSFGTARLTDSGLSAIVSDPAFDLATQPYPCNELLDLSLDPPGRFLGTSACRVRTDALDIPGGYYWSQLTAWGKIAPTRLYAVQGDVRYRLGLGGGAVWCDGALYLVIDPRQEHYGGRVVRWDGGGILATVYQAPLTSDVGPIRCGGDRLVVAAGSGFGAPQLTASLR